MRSVVVVVADPRTALDALQSRTPALLTTDVLMPGMSDIELAIKLRETNPDCKTILFSGQIATGQLLNLSELRVTILKFLQS
jgi:DNA-binding NarL/FixJ family response regulator